MSARQINTHTVILGGGLTGLSAAWHLKGQYYILLERENRVGGLANTDDCDGFKFDKGSHVWFTKDSYAESFIRSLPDVSMKLHERSAWVHIYDKLVPAPFQANLFGLPLSVVSDCLVGYIEEMQNRRRPISNFGDWLCASFGRGIYRHFMQPYNTKVWTVPPEELTTDWQGTRVDVPVAAELIDGAIGLRTNTLGMNAQFGYPDSVGIKSIVAAISRECSNIKCNASVSEIDLETKTVVLGDGAMIRYDALISTVPLPSFINLLSIVPIDVSNAAVALRSTQVLLINIALKAKPDHDYHWIYFAEPKYPFYRVSFPHNYSGDMCPSGCGSIQAECAFPSGVDIESKQVAENVQTRLTEAGYLDISQVLFVQTKMLKPAYVLCDHTRCSNLRLLYSYLEERSIYSCGRFGNWEYLNMDGCILAGRNAANWATSKANRGKY